MAAIEFHDVVKAFGKFRALDGLSLKVPAGAIFGLLGPNGAGKTTAIRVLMGLERATSGEVLVRGRRVPDRGLLPDMGYMPQETALYQDLTLLENLELFGALYGLRRSEVRERAEALLRLVALADWKGAVVSTLSGGMKHRASLVAALLHEPKVLVLDEPTVGVDPELRASFWQHFRELAARGTTVLITTHYMDEARNCGRIGLLRRGALIAEGTPKEILDRAGALDLEEAFLKLAGRGAAPRGVA